MLKYNDIKITNIVKVHKIEGGKTVKKGERKITSWTVYRYVVKCSQKQKRTTYFTDPNGNEQV